tara:strand:- start:475 stop:975 length:501 start_codon:yes stop_codon:yes gene_type:complete
MKKLFIALTFALPLMFVACETEEDTNTGGGTTDNGFWDVECTLSYDSVATTTCDSLWVNDSISGQWTTECDSILVTDSTSGNGYYTLDCKQVWSGGTTGGGYYTTTNCVTTYSLNTVETCDSVWVDDSSNGVDSTNNSGGNSGNTGGNILVDSNNVVLTDSSTAGI